MKAWCVSDKYGNCGTEIVFAETRGKAISLCLYDEVFGDYEWTELYARRFKEYDKYYEGAAKVDFWTDPEHRVRLVRVSAGRVLKEKTITAKIARQKNGAIRKGGEDE